MSSRSGSAVKFVLAIILSAGFDLGASAFAQASNKGRISGSSVGQLAQWNLIPKSTTKNKLQINQSGKPKSSNTPSIFVRPSTIKSTKKKGFDKPTVNALQQLGAKAKSGTATQSELEQLKALCDVASELGTSRKNEKKYDRSKTNKKDYNQDSSSDNNSNWDNAKSKKVNVKGEGSGLTMSGSGSVDTDFSSTKKGSKSKKKDSKKSGSFDKSSKNTFEGSSESEMNRAAQTECGSVLEYMATKETNASNERIQKLKNQDANEQREHELRMKQMELDALNRQQQTQQQNMWTQMGGSLLNNLLSPKQDSPQGTSQGSPDQEALMETIRKQQEQIEQLMQMQKSQPSSEGNAGSSSAD